MSDPGLSTSGHSEEEDQANLALSDSDDDDQGDDLFWDMLTPGITDFVDVRRDKLTLKYTGKASSSSDVGAARTTVPVPTRQFVFYYEVEVVDAGDKGDIMVGLASERFSLNRHPGWERGSYGYHASGNKHDGSPQGTAFGPRFGAGDIVGCGVLFSKQEVFFCKNGQMVGTAFSHVRPLGLFPTVGLHSRNETIKANFGSAPFAFNLQALVSEERDRLALQQSGVQVEVGWLHSAVASHLAAMGYQHTLQAFTNQHAQGRAGGGDDQDPVMRSLEFRSGVRELVMGGKVLEAVDALRQRYSEQMGTPGGRRVQFALTLQHFLELIASHQAHEAVVFARAHIQPLHSALHRDDLRLLKDAMALVAYTNPHAAPTASLLSPARRRAVADQTNQFVLACEGAQEKNVLEKVLSHSVVVHRALRLVNGGAGEVFELDNKQ